MSAEPEIMSLLHENRTFAPPLDFSQKAHISDMATWEKLWKESLSEPEAFWGRQARELLTWKKPFETVLTWKCPDAKWFEDGTLNVSENCVDRHARLKPNAPALIWEGESEQEVRTITWIQLQEMVERAANALLTLGVKQGSCVAIYMPMVPEIAVAMLACTRIGAAHTVIFGGFSSAALRDRILDSKSEILITADGGYRRGQEVPLKNNVDEALKETPCIRHALVLKRTGSSVNWTQGRDVDWHQALAQADKNCPPQAFPSENPLFILYTSGTTGKPKGLVHTSAGFLLGAALSSKILFDLKKDDLFWCTADCGWITGHTYVVYGPLANGTTLFMYEGAPNHPGPDRLWKLIAKHKVTHFYTAPTAIRSFMRWGDEHPKRHDLSSLRLLGTVGEPINPEAWMWYHTHIGGGGRCPIVDTWWQTETGSAMIAPLPGATPTTPGSATRPFFGVSPKIVHMDGRICERDEGGFLILDKPWPSMARTILGDHARYTETYWSKIPGVYFTGDGARQDPHGNFWIMGRVDDVLNVSGHRLGTMEIESAIVGTEGVAEAAVVGRPDPTKGQAVVAFVTPRQGVAPDEALKKSIQEAVVREIGSLARPDDIRFTDALPKTRSGKIMRRLLRELASTGTISGDVTTLEDLQALQKLMPHTDEE